jgi:phosphohistidine swiveling domain-containing protein
MDLVFPDVFRGLGEPVEIAPVLSGEKMLVGKPVSRGIARGKARVARTEEEARLVEPGEILIAPITDVGWTPLFRTIAGLATDIGSAVSHGAVVAREYGLPAVVDLRVATRTFVTGDRVVLDAITGVLKLDEDA